MDRDTTRRGHPAYKAKTPLTTSGKNNNATALPCTLVVVRTGSNPTQGRPTFATLLRKALRDEDCIAVHPGAAEFITNTDR